MMAASSRMLMSMLVKVSSYAAYLARRMVHAARASLRRGRLR
jgi:hypothetical protein